METKNLVKYNNKTLETRLLQSIKELPNHVIKTTCANDDAFNEPIIELSATQKSNLKNLINEI